MSISTLNSNDICARVRARWAPMLPLPLTARADHNISLVIPGGLERLAHAIRDSADKALLMKVVNKAPVAGVLDLTQADFAGMFPETFKRPGAITTQAESNLVFNSVPSFDALKGDFPDDSTCVWFYLRAKTHLHFRTPGTGALNTYATTLSLAGSYIAELGNAARPLPEELDDQAVDRVAEIVKELGGLAFLRMDPDQALQTLRAR